MKALVGHQNRWNALARAFAKGQTPQTLLIAGAPQVGKTTFFKRYAQLLLCPNVANDENGLPTPCGTCKVCHQVEIEIFPDFRVYRPIISASEETNAPEALDSSIITVKIARKMSDEAMLKPVFGQRKVLVMHQFDRISEEGQNALLKTLEEPPAGTFLVLTTENVKRLRDTILSRCWLLPLTPAPDAEIAAWLGTQFPTANSGHIATSLRAAYGRPGAAWREVSRQLGETGEASEQRSRHEVAVELVKMLDSFGPVGALRLTEEALKWAKQWWEEDIGEEADSKKLGAKGQRAAAARFLDELIVAGRSQWMGTLENEELRRVGAARLDQMRKTRQHILRNANLNLALDVMFGRLIALRPQRGAARNSRSSL